MTIAATAVVNNPTYKSWTITCADADTSGTFAHGMGATPDAVLLTSLISAATTSPVNWGYSVTSTVLTLLKQNIVGAGGTTPGTTPVLKVTMLLPNSAMQG